jgi:acyl-CoA thioesterase-1
MIARKLSAPLLALFLALLAASGGCGSDESSSDEEARASRAPAAPAAGVTGDMAAGVPGAADPADTDAPLVVFLGDSLTAGYGLPGDSAYPAVIARTLRDEGRPIRIVNAGSSGDTSAGGLSRLPWLLKQKPDVLVVALGGNDGLRGVPPATTRENLARIIQAAQAEGAEVLLLGLKMPPNYGPDFTEPFQRLYPELADELHVALVPFMLEGVAGHPELNQGDGIHPTGEGQRIVAENVLPALRALVERER